MKEPAITTQDILDLGYKLNELHKAYHEASDKQSKSQAWKTYYAAAQDYSNQVAVYIKSNPNNLSSVL